MPRLLNISNQQTSLEVALICVLCRTLAGRNKMNLAFNEKINTYKHHTYEFNQGGELDIKLCGANTFTIVLLNDKFYDVEHTLNSEPANWGRDEWIAISAIGQKIIELEGQAKKSK